jgi:hypothetical protein
MWASYQTYRYLWDNTNARNILVVYTAPEQPGRHWAVDVPVSPSEKGITPNQAKAGGRSSKLAMDSIREICHRQMAASAGSPARYFEKQAFVFRSKQKERSHPDTANGSDNQQDNRLSQWRPQLGGDDPSYQCIISDDSPRYN